LINWVARKQMPVLRRRPPFDNGGYGRHLTAALFPDRGGEED
jgi:hypothetical protein